MTPPVCLPARNSSRIDHAIILLDLNLSSCGKAKSQDSGSFVVYYNPAVLALSSIKSGTASGAKFTDYLLSLKHPK